MRRKTIADGILGLSVAAALASSPFQGESMAAAAAFHVSFAASVGGFADWFGVTSLFRRPLGISYRTNLIAKNRGKIVDMAKDMVTEEILSERRLKKLLVEHVPSEVVARWLTGHREGIKRILTAGIASALSSLHEEWLWSMTGGQLLARLPSIDWAGCLAAVMASFAAYPKKDVLAGALADEVKWFLQNEFTQEEIRKLYHAAWDEYEATGWLNFHRLFRKALSGREEELVSRIQEGVYGLADSLTDPESEVRKAIAEKYEEVQQRLAADTDTKEKLNRWISEMAAKLLKGKGKAWFLSTWEDKRDDLAAQLAEKLLTQAEVMVGDQEKRRRFDAWLLSLILPHVKDIHRIVSAVVEKKLAQYDGSAMARLAEEAASEEVAAIRLNGSLFGAVLGLLFYAAGVLL